jgi:hypothetical protein
MPLPGTAHIPSVIAGNILPDVDDYMSRDVVADGADAPSEPALYGPARGDEDAMSHTVACPECHRPATVLDRFSLAGTDGPVEYLRIRCTGLLSFLTPASEIPADEIDRLLPTAS